MKIPTEGKISSYSVYTILEELGRIKGTGSLTLSSREDTIVLTFEFGLCVGIESHYPKECFRLGQLMVQRKLIDDLKLDQLLEKQKQVMMKFGKIVRDEGLVTSLQLMDLLEDQMLLVLFPALTWTNGLYYFRTESSVLFDKDSFRPLDLTDILKQGTDILKDWPWINERFPDFRAVPALLPEVDVLPPGVKTAPKSPESSTPIVLTSEQEKVYTYINGLMSIEELISSCHQFAWHTLKALVDLEDQGVISVPALREEKQSIGAFWDGLQDKVRDLAWYAMLGVGALILIMIFTYMPIKILPSLASKNLKKEQIVFAKAKMDQIRFALAVYEFKNNRFPEFLSELKDGNNIREDELVDPWDAKFYYRRSKTGYLLVSMGSDSQWATADDISIESDRNEFANGCFFPDWIKKEEEKGKDPLTLNEQSE